jgi:hypothetical protein
MTEAGPEDGKTRPEEVAAYIAVLTAEMVRLARKHKLQELAYLLDLARLEAAERSPRAPGCEKQRIA